LVDAIAGRDKYDLCNAMIRGMDAATRDEFFNRISAAMRAHKYLTELRHKGVKDSKKKAKEWDSKVNRREYRVSKYTIDEPIPCENSSWSIKTSEWKKGNPKIDGLNYKLRNGMHEMFHFRILPEMPANFMAVRRMPCLCEFCYKALDVKWEEGLDPKKQPMFRRAQRCVLGPVMGDLNDWQLIELTPKEGGSVCEVEVNQIKTDGLEMIATSHEETIKAENYGAINVEAAFAKDPEFYSLVRWTSEPFMLTEPTLVANCGNVPMEDGTMVARGVEWTRVRSHGTEWFQPPKDDAKEQLFWLQHVLEGDLELLESTLESPPAEALLPWNKDRSNDCFRVDDQRLRSLRKEKALRDEMTVVDVPDWEERKAKKKERKDKQIKKKADSQEEKAAKRLFGLLNRVVDTRPPENFTF
jgi:hypothetical protein